MDQTKITELPEYDLVPQGSWLSSHCHYEDKMKIMHSTKELLFEGAAITIWHKMICTNRGASTWCQKLIKRSSHSWCYIQRPYTTQHQQVYYQETVAVQWTLNQDHTLKWERWISCISPYRKRMILSFPTDIKTFPRYIFFPSILYSMTSADDLKRGTNQDSCLHIWQQADVNPIIFHF